MTKYNYRFEEFEFDHPGESASVCIVSALPSNTTDTDPFGCDTTITDDVYLHTVYIGLACVPGSILVPLLIHKLGAKFFLSKFNVKRHSSIDKKILVNYLT